MYDLIGSRDNNVMRAGRRFIMYTFFMKGRFNVIPNSEISEYHVAVCIVRSQHPYLFVASS